VVFFAPSFETGVEDLDLSSSDEDTFTVVTFTSEVVVDLSSAGVVSFLSVDFSFELVGAPDEVNIFVYVFSFSADTAAESNENST